MANWEWSKYSVESLRLVHPKFFNNIFASFNDKKWSILSGFHGISGVEDIAEVLGIEPSVSESLGVN